MDPQDAIDLVREAIMLALWISAPVLIVGMAVGLLVGLIQALTQVQEQTLSFAVKLIAVAVTLLLSMNWIGSELYNYTLAIFQTIEQSAR